MVFNFFKKDKNEHPENQPPKQEQGKSFWGISVDNLKKVVSNTAQSLVNNVINQFEDAEELNDFILDDMEDALIKADLGVSVATDIVDTLRKRNEIKPSKVREYLQDSFSKILSNAGSTELSYKENELNIYFITGVNGAGKTTLIGKLANKFKQEGKKVLIAAADTICRSKLWPA